jgi:hypothetical protein
MNLLIFSDYLCNSFLKYIVIKSSFMKIHVEIHNSDLNGKILFLILW